MDNGIILDNSSLTNMLIMYSCLQIDTYLEENKLLNFKVVLGIFVLESLRIKFVPQVFVIDLFHSSLNGK